MALHKKSFNNILAKFVFAGTAVMANATASAQSGNEDVIAVTPDVALVPAPDTPTTDATPSIVIPSTQSDNARTINNVTCTVTRTPFKQHVAMLVNVSNGEAIASRCDRIDSMWTPASLTKLLAIYVAFDKMKNSHGRITGDTTFTISKDVAADTSTIRIGYKAGEKVSVRDLITAAVVHSANDAPIALAEGFSGSKEAFVREMNATAKKLGMTNTDVNTASGLPLGKQNTTAREMALLITAINNDFPEYADWLLAREYRHNKTVFPTHILVNKDPYIQKQEKHGVLNVGIAKTGFTGEALYNIALQVKAKEQEWVAIVMGAPDKDERTRTIAFLLQRGVKMWLPVTEKAPGNNAMRPFQKVVRSIPPMPTPSQ